MTENEGEVAVAHLMTSEVHDGCAQIEAPAHVVMVEEHTGSVTLELPDGSHTIVEDDSLRANSDELQQESVEGVAVQLEDGRIGYLCSDTHNLLQTVAPVVSSRFLCSYQGCNKVYSTTSHLRIHQRIHTRVRPYVCEICKKGFNTSFAMKSHIRTHTGEKPYRCPEETCPKRFKTSGDLQKHVRTHTGERPFKCQLCGKAFTTSDIRKVHMRVHTGEKPYKCSVEGCSRMFASATNYKNHMRIHTGEKPYVCSVENCGRRFTEYSSLYKHHMVHNQQKPYACTHCGRFYRQLSTLAVHRRTVHGVVDGGVGNEGVLLVDQSGLEVDPLLNTRSDTNLTLNASGLHTDTGDLSSSMVGLSGVNVGATVGAVDIGSRVPPSILKNKNRSLAKKKKNNNSSSSSNNNSRKVIQVTNADPIGELDSDSISVTVGEDGCVSVSGDISPSDLHSLLSGDTLFSDTRSGSSFNTSLPSSSLTNLELDASGNSILVLTDPSQLAALQQFAVGSETITGDTVEVLTFENFPKKEVVVEDEKAE
ncbi:uncharacterized protein LOC143020252 [Oratosquilla oratoria]|uniref:uncharacterized protein LOC143020252 n=1 Tax=Oratosquilla oratoria TaxID=337810 RepID=UPI003F77250F